MFFRETYEPSSLCVKCAVYSFGVLDARPLIDIGEFWAYSELLTEVSSRRFYFSVPMVTELTSIKQASRMI